MTHHMTWCVIEFDWGWWLDLATPVMTHHVTWCVICHAWTITWRLCIWVVWGKMREKRDCSIFACALWQGLKWTSLQTIIKPDSVNQRQQWGRWDTLSWSHVHGFWKWKRRQMGHSSCSQSHSTHVGSTEWGYGGGTKGCVNGVINPPPDRFWMQGRWRRHKRTCKQCRNAT